MGVSKWKRRKHWASDAQGASLRKKVKETIEELGIVVEVKEVMDMGNIV
jgi:uncharacterized protein YjcR